MLYTIYIYYICYYTIYYAICYYTIYHIKPSGSIKMGGIS